MRICFSDAFENRENMQTGPLIFSAVTRSILLEYLWRRSPSILVLFCQYLCIGYHNVITSVASRHQIHFPLDSAFARFTTWDIDRRFAKTGSISIQSIDVRNGIKTGTTRSWVPWAQAVPRSIFWLEDLQFCPGTIRYDEPFWLLTSALEQWCCATEH